MTENQTDGVNNYVFDEHNNERAPWKCCSETLIPRSEIVFIVQISIVTLIIILCFAMLFFSCQKVVRKNQFGLLYCQV